MNFRYVPEVVGLSDEHEGQLLGLADFAYHTLIRPVTADELMFALQEKNHCMPMGLHPGKQFISASGFKFWRYR